MQRVKWERRSHIYTQWANRIIFENNCVVCKTQYQFLDIDSSNAYYLFVRFRNALLLKHDIGSLMPFPHSFFLDIISTTRQKVLMDARRRVLPPSIDFPSTTLMTNYSVEESTTRYSKSGMKSIFIESRILVACSKSRILVLEYEFSIRNSFSIIDPTIKISVPLGSSLFSVQATQVS